MRESGPDKPCRRAEYRAAADAEFGPSKKPNCADAGPHLAGEHLNPRSPLYDGPSITFGALPHQCRRAAYALMSAGAPVPEIVDMAEEILRLRRQVAAVQVDADRQIRRAMERAKDCVAHGDRIRQLEHQLDLVDQQYERAKRGSATLLASLLALDNIVATQQLPDGLDDLPLREVVAQWSKRTHAAYDRAHKDRDR